MPLPRYPRRLATGCAVAAAVIAAVAGVAVAQQPPARTQAVIVNASPSWVPIGTSASGATTAVWFHEPGSRQAVACRLVDGAGGAAVQCVAGKLP